jgi:hypothetical protein
MIEHSKHRLERAIGGTLLALTLISLGIRPAAAQSNRITCTGILIDVDLSAGAEWPLAVIYDSSGHYTCTIDRKGSGHDPLRPCSVGEKCRVVGTFRKIGQTYSIRTIVSVDTP